MCYEIDSLKTKIIKLEWEPEILIGKQKDFDCYFLNAGALLQHVAYITRCPKTWTSTVLLPGVIVGRKYAPYEAMKELVERAVKLWFFMALNVEQDEHLEESEK